jgi:hypothetical protein
VSRSGIARLRAARAMLLGAAGLLCACSTKPMKVGWEFDPAGKFSGLHSYAWIPGPQKRTGDPRVDDSWTDRRVRQAVDTQLAAQGFVVTSPEQADFWVGYHVLLLDKVQTSTTGTYYGYNRSWGGDAGLDLGWNLGGAPTTYSQRHDVGTLTVFIEAPATQRPIWQGFAQAEIQPSDDMETRDKRLAKAAKLILEKFPPGATSPTPASAAR